MFAESLLESGHVHPKGRGWATTLSIAIQSLLLAALVALPIFRPDKLLLEPKPLSSPIALGVPEATPPSSQRPQRGSTSTSARPIFTEPKDIPTGPVNPGPVSTEPAPETCFAGCNAPPGNIGGVPNGLGKFLTPPPVVAVKPDRPPVVSQLALGGLIHQVQPVYPRNAVAIRLEGTVMMRALVDREGRIAALQVLSGHPFFVNAAKDAVSQWRYRPYVLNGQPIEVETQITVNFKLNH